MVIWRDFENQNCKMEIIKLGADESKSSYLDVFSRLPLVKVSGFV